MAAPVFANAAMNETSFASSLTITVTGGSTADRALIALFTSDSTSEHLTSATCNGNAMTAFAISGDVLPTSSSRRIGVAWIVGDSNINTGSNTVVGNYTDGNHKPGGIAIVYSGCDGTTPFTEVQTLRGVSTGPSQSTTTDSSHVELAIGIIVQSGTSNTATSPSVIQFTQRGGSGATDTYYAEDRLGTGAGAAVASTLGSSTEWVHSLFVVNPGTATASTKLMLTLGVG